MKFSISLFIIICFQIVSCTNRTTKLTKAENASRVKVSSNLYSQDSLELVTLIKNDIKEHKGGYHSQAYDSTTTIIIDTILYNPTFDKLSFFIIDRKENKKIYPKTLTREEIAYLVKQGHSSLPYDGYHYTGKAYLAKRLQRELRINHFGITTANYNSMDMVRQRQRQIYFEEYAAVEEKGFEYNFDDKRFWSNPNVWEKFRED